LGTDVNKESLEKSIQGFYKEWSFRGAPQWLKKDFFAKTDGGYHLDPSVISLVEFRYLNMASQDYSLALQDFTPVDIILCRNTMMYFTSDLRNRIIDRMLSWLSEDGWLILSPSEVPHVTNHKLKLVMAPGAVFFRRKRKVSEKPLSSSVEIVEDIKQDRWIIEKPEPTTALVPKTSTRKDLTVPSRAESRSLNLKNDLELARKALSISDYRKTIELLKNLPDKQADPTLLGDRQFTLARACANLGLLNEAQESIEAALKLDKLNPAYHHMFASILQARNMNQEAVERLQRVLFLDPNHVMANVTLGTIQSGPNNRAESLRYLRNAMTLLDQLAPGEIVPDSDGATAVHIKEMVKSAILNMA
jgi:chemotaxis protein methyltransferase CheR